MRTIEDWKLLYQADRLIRASWQSLPKKHHNPTPRVMPTKEHDFQLGEAVIYLKRGNHPKGVLGRYAAVVTVATQSNDVPIKFFVPEKNTWYWSRTHYSNLERAE